MLRLPNGYKVTSDLKASDEEALEKLLFFNRNQARIREALRQAIERYGTPKIRHEGDHLTLEIANIPQVQTLYLFHERATPALVGVVVYVREGSVLRVIYVGLDPEHDYTARREDHLLLRIFDTLRNIGQRIRGVEAVEFTTGRRNLRLSVARRAPDQTR